ncbi:MAG: hydrogenase nickel incorporation protein HypA [Thermoprotei archaeon]
MVHEWALAEAIAEYVVGEARSRGSNSINRLVIKLGLLQNVDREILDFALRNILDERGIRVSRIDYIEEDIKLRCRRCGYEWSINMSSIEEYIREAIHFVPEAVYAYFKCPRCGSRDFEILSGRGVEIGVIEWE